MRKIQALAVGATLLLFSMAGVANAALVTQTINFRFDDFVPAGLASSPSLIAEVTGAVSITYDTATPASIFNQAVDSISFGTPSSFFLTSDVRFDLYIGADRFSATNSYELNFYNNLLGVEFGLVGDFLFRTGAIGPIGADVPGGGAMSAQFLLIDQPGTDGFYKVSDGPAKLLTSTSVPAAAIPEPAPLMVLGFGLAAFGLSRRRR